MQCIFCRQDASASSRVEHIFPESLGGDDWCVLPPGVVCDSCNQYFGSKIESVAIADYPLNLLRIMNGVITKKKKWATMPHATGLLEARPYPRLIGIEPGSEGIERAILDGRITQSRMIAMTRYPAVLCRMLLKIAVEMIAHDDPTVVFDPKFDAARRFARAPRKGSRWWFLYKGDPSTGLDIPAHSKPICASTHEYGEEEMAHIELFGFSFLVPVTANFIPDGLDALPEPENRFFNVTI